MMKMRAAIGDGLESEQVEALTWQVLQIFTCRVTHSMAWI